MSLFKVKEEITATQRVLLGLLGPGIILIIWIFLTRGDDPILNSAILPKPWRVLTAYQDLYQDNEIIRNVMKSIGLNLSGYIEAVLIAVPVGFLIGLYPFFRGSFKGMVEAIRYVALTALTGLFIAWFGVGTSMKIHFLSFGILIYLLPVIVQRIDEVKDVYLKTVYTLGATDWQTIKTVYIPSVMSRVSDDIRVLTAISWTYIIVAEGIGSTGGVGALIWRAGLRQGRIDKVFAILLIIMLIGVLQDRLFIYLDRLFFPHKYVQKEKKRRQTESSSSFLALVGNFVQSLGVWILLGFYLLLLIDQFVPIIADQSILRYYFADTTLAIHFIAASILLFQLLRYLRKKEDEAIYRLQKESHGV